MAISHPLDLPEILTSVGDHLKPNQLVRCLRVCKTWHRILLPSVWKTVLVDDGEGDQTSKRQPSQDDFLRYHELIFHLRITCSQIGVYATHLPNLNTLVISSPPLNKHNAIHKVHGTKMINLNPSLVELSICVISEVTADADFWKAVSDLPYLNILRVTNVNLEIDEVEVFWGVCSKLEEAQLQRMSFPKDYTRATTFSFPRMRKLGIDISSRLDCTVQLEFIRQCPQLEELSWRVVLDTSVLDGFASGIEQGLWPRLERLQFHHSGTDDYSSRILNGLQRITQLNNSNTQFGSLSFQSLQHHFNNLKELDLRKCRSVTSAMLLEVLCSCQYLEKLRGNFIKAKDIAKGRPFVSLCMKQLEVCIEFSQWDQHFQPLVYGKLSALVRLEELNVSDWHLSRLKSPFQRNLDLRLDCGLGQLSGLKNIKTIIFRNSTQTMEEADVQWMIDNWKRLGSVIGEMSQNQDTRDRLEMMLINRDIAVYD